MHTSITRFSKQINMKGIFPVDKFAEIETPFYYYDTNLLRQTLDAIREETSKHERFCVHYAVKANANPKILNIICQSGLGADCVSGGEIQACLNAGFAHDKICLFCWCREK
jgi:diaminopimelate decarboxylase